MRILHVTAHLPPDQAANSLLPYQLGRWAHEDGDEVAYVSHPPRAGGTVPLAGPVTWIPRHQPRSQFARITKLAAVLSAMTIIRAVRPLLETIDLVHVHSNGLLAELTALMTSRYRKPYVLTLYGTEIWHYQPKRYGPDLFTRCYRDAAHVTFYSQGLSSKAQELCLTRRNTSVVYPPVDEAFHWHDSDAQAEKRASLGFLNRHLLLNVKRLHPLAGQRYLIEAMNEVIRTHPDTRLVICGAGPLLTDLKKAAVSAGVGGHVTFTGLVGNAAVAAYCAAADVFVLPSLLEACPTVALEALASGTPVITADNPGGLELYELFGSDVTVVPRQNAMALARAIVHQLKYKRRTRDSTHSLIEREFRAAQVARQFRDIYGQVLSSPASL